MWGLGLGPPMVEILLGPALVSVKGCTLDESLVDALGSMKGCMLDESLVNELGSMKDCALDESLVNELNTMKDCALDRKCNLDNWSKRTSLTKVVYFQDTNLHKLTQKKHAFSN